METRKEFITEIELYRHTEKIKKELKQDIKEVASSVDSLEKTILPITGFLKAIEQNTRETSIAIKELTKEQKVHTDKLHTHDIAINDLQRDDDVKIEKEKGKWNVIGIITAALLAGGSILDKYGPQISAFFFGGK